MEFDENEGKLQEAFAWWLGLSDEERNELMMKSIEEFVEGERHGSDREVFGTRSVEEQENG